MEQPRAAATLIAARDARRGPEVLVLRRSGKHRFLPGYVVFPGGAVEETDGELAGRWFGDDAEIARACALRELGEEAGLVATESGWRTVSGEVETIAALDASPPPRGRLHEVSHWIAPVDVPVRFDARFFAIEAPRGLEPAPASPETDRAWWARPSDLLEAGASGGFSLYWPTMKVLEGLAGCPDVRALTSLRIPQVEPDPRVQLVG